MEVNVIGIMCRLRDLGGLRGSSRVGRVKHEAYVKRVTWVVRW